MDKEGLEIIFKQNGEEEEIKECVLQIMKSNII